jgi:hypothetical protein
MSGDHDKKRIFGILKILGKMSYLLKKNFFEKNENEPRFSCLPTR